MDKDNEFEKMQNTGLNQAGSPDAQENVQKVSLDELKKMKDEIRKEQGLPPEDEIVIEPSTKSQEPKADENHNIENNSSEQTEGVNTENQTSENDKTETSKPAENNNPSENTENAEPAKSKKIAVKGNLVFFSSSPDDFANEEEDKTETETNNKSETEEIITEPKPQENTEEKAETEVQNETTNEVETKPQTEQESAESSKPAAKVEPEKQEEPVISIVKQTKDDKTKKHHGLFGKHDKEAHVEKIDLSELEEAKQEISKGKEEVEIDTEYDENDGSIKSRIVKQKKTIFSKPEETYVAPDESLPDDITEADILAQMEQDELKNAPKDDEEQYEGMTEEEIIAAKERKRRLDDLKHKYNEREVKDPNDIGDYKKNLDFSINKDIKHFRIKPPKKPFIITSVILAVVIALSVVLALVIINQPPAEIVLQSIRLSQKTTYQYVGDDLDLRGLYIEKVFSDKHVETVKVTSDMITSTSENIDSTLKIGSLLDDTFVKFTYQGFSDTLSIVLINPTITGLSSVEIYQSKISKGGVIKFDNILILATVVDPISGDLLGTKRINAKDAVYSFESLGKTLSNGTVGVEMDGETVGTVVLTITYRVDGNSFSLTKEIKII